MAVGYATAPSKSDVTWLRNGIHLAPQHLLYLMELRRSLKGILQQDDSG